MITKEEALAAISVGTLPSALDALISEILDEDIAWQARMLLAARHIYARELVCLLLRPMQGVPPAYMDDF